MPPKNAADYADEIKAMYPATTEELGYQIRPMLLKKDCGIQQVGDYQAYYSGPGIAGWVGLLVERKGGEKEATRSALNV